MPGTNALAYFFEALATKIKCIITSTPDLSPAALPDSRCQYLKTFIFIFTDVLATQAKMFVHDNFQASLTFVNMAKHDQELLILPDWHGMLLYSLTNNINA